MVASAGVGGGRRGVKKSPGRGLGGRGEERERNRVTEKRRERQRQGAGREASQGRRQGGDRRYFEGVGSRWGPWGERAPSPEYKMRGLEGAVLGFGGEGRDGRGGGVEVSSRFPSPPNLERQRKKESVERSTRTERKRELERENDTGRNHKGQRQVERQEEARETGREKSWEGKGEIRQKGDGET